MMWVAWISLGLGVASTVFWVGVYFGSVRGKLARDRVRIRDLERAYAKIAQRPFVSRFPDEGARKEQLP